MTKGDIQLQTRHCEEEVAKTTMTAMGIHQGKKGTDENSANYGNKMNGTIILCQLSGRWKNQTHVTYDI